MTLERNINKKSKHSMATACMHKVGDNTINLILNTKLSFVRQRTHNSYIIIVRLLIIYSTNNKSIHCMTKGAY